MKFFTNKQQGFGLVGAMMAAVVATIAIAGISEMLGSMSERLRRAEARLELNATLQEIQARTLHSATCEQLITSAQALDMAAMEQDHLNEALGPRPGTPVQVRLLNGDVLDSSDPENSWPGSRFQVEHLALTNREGTGRLGPNGHPLHQAVLVGAFSARQRNNTTRQLRSDRLASLFIEVDPATNMLTSCFGGGDDNLSLAQTQCLMLGGQWDVATATCNMVPTVTPVAGADDTTAPAPLPATGTVFDGTGCNGISWQADGIVQFRGFDNSHLSRVNTTVTSNQIFPAGTVVNIKETVKAGANRVSYSLLQCINGSWKTPVVRIGQDFDQGGG